MKKICMTIIVTALFTLNSATVFASTNPIVQSQEPVAGEKIIKVLVNETEPQDNRHRTKKEEVGRIENQYIYPSDVSFGGADSTTSLVRAYVYSEIHYKVYRVRIGDPDYKVFLYDEYHTTWHGEKRDTTKSAWKKVQDKKTEVTKKRSALEDMIGMLT